MGWAPETTSGDPIAADCRTEVVELHRFLGWWMRGEVPETDAAFALVADALAPDFLWIPPEGPARDRAATLAALRAAHAAHAAAQPPPRIWIAAYRCRPLGADHALAVYEEWQTRAGGDRGRRVTALFRRSPDRPNGVVWEHRHETWLPDEPALAGPGA